MKDAVRMLGVVLGFVLLVCPARPLAQSATIRGELLEDWMEMQATMPAIGRNATSKAEVMKAMADSFDYGEALVHEQTDASMFEVVQTNAFLGPLSRARAIYFLVGHSWDIYGQMVVYPRLNGGVPPASQRS